MKEGRCDWKRVKGWIDVIVKSRVKRGGGNLEIARWREIGGGGSYDYDSPNYDYFHSFFFPELVPFPLF